MGMFKWIRRMIGISDQEEHLVDEQLIGPSACSLTPYDQQLAKDVAKSLTPMSFASALGATANTADGFTLDACTKATQFRSSLPLALARQHMCRRSSKR